MASERQAGAKARAGGLQGAIGLAATGAALATVAPLLLPVVELEAAGDAAGRAVAGGDLWPVGVAVALSAAALGVALTAGWRARQPVDPLGPAGTPKPFASIRRLGIPIAALAAAALLALGLTWAFIWPLVPCQELSLSPCDSAGGLVEGTPVQLAAGGLLAALGAAMAMAGGLGLVAAHPAWERGRRFLRVGLSWGDEILWERVYFHRQPVSVGEADDATVQVAAAGLVRHLLLVPAKGDRWTLNVPRGVEGKLQLGGQSVAAAGVGEAEVGRGDHGILTFDNGVRIAFGFTGAERAVLSGGRQDPAPWVAFAGVVALVAGILAVAGTARRGGELADGEALALREDSRMTITEVDMVQPPEPTPDANEGPTIEPPNKKVDTAPEPEGQTGKPDVHPDLKTKATPKDAKPTDVREIGLAKVLAGAMLDDGALRTVMAGDTGAMDDRMAAPVDGTDDADTLGHGPGGRGLRHTGSGGGGENGPHSLRAPTEGLDTGTHGRNTTVAIGRKKPRPVSPTREDPIAANAGCDKGDIQKQVRSKAATLRACYETQLLTRPDLEGKITAQWTISGDGRTTNVRLVSDTVSQAAVGDCVQRALGRIRFQPPAAGVCVVQWPFVFSSGR